MKKEEKARLEYLEQKEEKRRQQKNERERRYNQNTVDRMAFTLPKGRKEDVQKAAAARGLSVNAFIQSIVLAAIDGPAPES